MSPEVAKAAGNLYDVSRESPLVKLERFAGAVFVAESYAFLRSHAGSHVGKVAVCLFGDVDDVVDVVAACGNDHHVVGKGSSNGVLLFHERHPWSKKE